MEVEEDQTVSISAETQRRKGMDAYEIRSANVFCYLRSPFFVLCWLAKSETRLPIAKNPSVLSCTLIIMENFISSHLFLPRRMQKRLYHPAPKEPVSFDRSEFIMRPSKRNIPDL